MPIETMAFILGGLLVGVGILGGGIEIRELKIPPVGQVPRILSLMAGLAFVGLAVMLQTKQFEEPGFGIASRPNAIQAAEKQIFYEPRYGDYRLDACYEWGVRCGEDAATAWCRTKGFVRAVDFPTENVGKQGIVTKLIGTQVECRQEACASFASITCEK